jgi:hypothetical protein
MPNYADIDYEQFPVADLDLDLHWIQLPAPSSPNAAKSAMPRRPKRASPRYPKTIK